MAEGRATSRDVLIVGCIGVSIGCVIGWYAHQYRVKWLEAKRQFLDDMLKQVDGQLKKEGVQTESRQGHK